MKNLISRKSHKVHSMFMLAGVAAMMGATVMVPQAAHADKAQNYKIGAAALGILGVVLAAKGNTGPAILAGAGSVYAYNQGQQAQEDERWDNRDNYYRYNRNDYRNNDYRNNDYRNNDYRNNDYRNNDYNDRYDNRDNRYNNNRYNDDNNRHNDHDDNSHSWRH